MSAIPTPVRVFCLVATSVTGLSISASAQFNTEINRQVWKQKYGVLDAQMNEQAPYAGWLSQDADGDGVKNGDEFVAGTSPFKKLAVDPNFRPPAVANAPTTLSLTFPTVPGKVYGLESSDSLLGTWARGTLPGVDGDGTNKTLVAPKSAGKFFHLSVTDKASQGDMVSDWAKFVLGYSMNSPIGSQTGFNQTTLAASLQQQNTVTLAAIDLSGTQPPTASAAATDTALIRITRSGYMLLGDTTVGLTITGTGVAGTDYAPLPASVTFPAGVNSLDLKITPLFNASRTGPRTVVVTAKTPGSAGSAGNYNLGTPSSARVTVYPANNPAGSGLTGNYYPGSSSTYASPLNFSELTTASYSYTRTNSTTGTATVTYNNSGTSPMTFTVGAAVSVQFTTGNLGTTSPFSTLRSYTISATSTGVSFTVPITGTSLPNSSSGVVGIAGYTSSVTRLAPLIDSTWGYGSPNGNVYVNADNYSVAWEGYLGAATGNYVFRLDADDKARILIDKNDGNGLQQVLENGWDSVATGGYKLSNAIALTAPATPADRQKIRLEFVETTGSAKCRMQWQFNGGSFVTIPVAVATPNVWKDNVSTDAITANLGWNGSYYNNTTFTAPAARTQLDTDPTAGSSGDWLTGGPDPAIFHNNYSSRWTGQVLPQYSQPYYFVVKANQGAKLWVNNQLIIDQWADATSDRTSTPIDLQAGVLYDIKLEHYETTGTSEAHLSWYSEDQAKQVIPTSRLFPTITGTTPIAGNPPAGEPIITSPTHPVAISGAGPVSIPVTSSNGGTITFVDLPAWLSFSGGVLTGTPPGPGIYQFTVVTTNGTSSSSVVITLEVLAAGNQLTRELWTTGVTGPAIADVPWTSTPSNTDTVSVAEDATTTYGTNTGERLRGYFIAPTTGNYYFWIAASNTAELWISNDAEPVNKVRRAFVTGPTGTAARTWNSQPKQKSQWLSLIGGQKYYIEALHNTGASGSGNHLSVAWYLDPTGNMANPIANGSAPALPTVGGVMPGSVISPWDNPPTTTIPGSIYVTNLQGVEGLGNITATGGAFLRVNGLNAVLQLNYSGLTSGAISKKLYNGSGQVIFDLDAQNKNYPGLKTTDGGYSWTMQAADLTALNNAQVYIGIATVNNPNGEISGTFGKTSGSQAAPAVPVYPAWSDVHATNDAENSRFLSQATFGPSTADMDAVKTSGYRTWIDNQMALAPTRTLPYMLANLSADPQNPYSNTTFFNSWWRNAISAPDQLRQRAAFALSEILVVSDTGPLNNNGRTLADYYDVLLDNSFGNFRDILKQVTLSSAMGVYLDMRGNAKGSIITGVHPNENYAREILQLFSAGLYRTWPDGTLVLDSKGLAIPTYDQSVITGFARVFTGWSWGQAMVSSRLPTSFPNTSNYLDPMLLVPTNHELGTKILLDNVMLPAATVTSQGDASTDPTSTYYVQSTDPVLGPGNLVNTLITNQYDLNGVRDLEVTLDNILANSATGPYICRQLIQRLVTSHPKPEYVARVVRAFNGERNVDGVATGVRGDMAEVFRAILLDYEARSSDAAADPKFGKQREPLMRVTGPARSLAATNFANSTYSQTGTGSILITTPTPHRLISGETVRLANFVDSNSVAGQVPTTQNYSVVSPTANTFTVSNNGTTSMSYMMGGDATNGYFTTVTPAGLVSGDKLYIKFTAGEMAASTAFDQVYTVGAAGTVVITGAPAPITPTPTRTCLVPRITSGYSVSGSAGAQTISIQTTGNHNLVGPKAGATETDPVVPGDLVQLKFITLNTPVGAANGVYEVTSVVGPNLFKVAVPGAPAPAITNGSQGGSSVTVYPLKGSQWTRSGTVTVELSNFGVGATPSNLNQTPLNSTTVFNFFYPDYQYPGELANAGMTTPEFQLTNDSNTMNLTNTITSGVLSSNSGNNNGYLSFFANAVTMDLAPYMTSDQTSNTAVPALVDKLSNLLCGGNVTPAVRATISAYVANTTNFPLSTTPTNTEMRNRVRAIVHLITTSADYAIQK